ncbi:hypothetical protein [Thermoanaerobacterium sp. RBIITD]|uniref:hypothetical protein n=1 Tax=Thermoanaerobacterium sp. RBIITD TaxID=1550240 RepID=UPI000BB8CBA8|nr:hypothetical protein [Thermoanaerobacterium sp. RBIITD]SNX55078.1 40-residue YVTN family beta-propeller repeat-containing protein [Thermoanaerobacterium sp. RBIITD]
MNIFVANKGDDTIARIKNVNNKKFIKLVPNENNFLRNSKSQEPFVGPHRLLFNKECNKLYSLNVFDDSISIIDLNDFKLINTFYAGSCPNDGFILNNHIFITNGDADCVSIFDVECGKISEQIKVGGQPQEILYNKRYDRIFVSNMNSDSITFINPCDFNTEKDLIVDSRPFGMCFSDDERYLFITNTYLETGLDGTITIYDVLEDKVLNKIKCGKLPTSIAFCKDYLFVINSCSNTLMKINLKTLQYDELFCGYMPSYISLYENYAFISNAGENKLLIVNIDKLSIEKSIEVGKEPDGLILEA